MRWLLVILVWAGCSFVAFGKQPENTSKQAEASLLVTGSVDVNPDGSIKQLALDQPEQLPKPVVELVQHSVMKWKLQFISPPGEVVTEKLSLRVRGRSEDAGHMSIAIVSAQFDDANLTDAEHLRSDSRTLPTYPRESIDAKVSGTVYLLLQVGRDGKVQEIAAEQVNLRIYGPEATMAAYRKNLAKAAIRAGKSWTYHVPTQGKNADAPFWLVRVPVNFNLRGAGLERISGGQYGQWEIYIPGPREDVPWVRDRAILAEAPDATPDGAIHQLGAGPTFVTPSSG